MAEGLLKQALPGYDISSAGLGALVGQPADPLAVDLMHARGVDISAHRARQFDSWMLEAADLLLVMDIEQKRFLEQQYPLARGKIFRLCDAADADIADPYRQERTAFEEAEMLVVRGVNAWVERITTIGLKKRQSDNNRNSYC